MRTVKDIEAELEEAKKVERQNKYQEWDKKALEFVKKEKGNIYKNSLYFPDSKEKVQYWVYKISGIDISNSPYKILHHSIYITDMAQSFKLNEPIYNSCAYITHGMTSTNKEIWDEALNKFIELSK